MNIPWTTMFERRWPLSSQWLWKSRWPCWNGGVPNKPGDFCGRKATLKQMTTIDLFSVCFALFCYPSWIVAIHNHYLQFCLKEILAGQLKICHWLLAVSVSSSRLNHDPASTTLLRQWGQPAIPSVSRSSSSSNCSTEWFCFRNFSSSTLSARQLPSPGGCGGMSCLFLLATTMLMIWQHSSAAHCDFIVHGAPTRPCIRERESELFIVTKGVKSVSRQLKQLITLSLSHTHTHTHTLNFTEKIKILYTLSQEENVSFVVGVAFVLECLVKTKIMSCQSCQQPGVLAWFHRVLQQLPGGLVAELPVGGMVAEWSWSASVVWWCGCSRPALVGKLVFYAQSTSAVVSGQF